MRACPILTKLRSDRGLQGDSLNCLGPHNRLRLTSQHIVLHSVWTPRPLNPPLGSLHPTLISRHPPFLEAPRWSPPSRLPSRRHLTWSSSSSFSSRPSVLRLTCVQSSAVHTHAFACASLTGYRGSSSSPTHVMHPCLMLCIPAYPLRSPSRLSQVPRLDADSELKAHLKIIDEWLAVAFVIEMLLKITTLGFAFTPKAYLKDGWNVTPPPPLAGSHWLDA